VRVELVGGETARFFVGASWLAMSQIARAPDPDGRPRSANALEAGKAVSDAVEPAAGDQWDWFAVQSAAAGTLTVLTKAPEGDLVLEVFADGSFRARQVIAKHDEVYVPPSPGTTPAHRAP
jgi:hypothetical protein